MKATGVVRNIDELGRIVVPKEIRRAMNIAEKDPIEIFTENDMIILKKYAPSCVFCENANGLVSYNGKNVCPACLEKLRSLA